MGRTYLHDHHFKTYERIRVADRGLVLGNLRGRSDIERLYDTCLQLVQPAVMFKVDATVQVFRGTFFNGFRSLIQEKKRVRIGSRVPCKLAFRLSNKGTQPDFENALDSWEYARLL